jgi:dihydropteroate synthase
MGTSFTGIPRLGVEIEDRLEGPLAATALAAKAGAPVVRVHKVEETRLPVEMIAGIVGESSCIA